jgi:hypothetical protein
MKLSSLFTTIALTLTMLQNSFAAAGMDRCQTGTKNSRYAIMLAKEANTKRLSIKAINGNRVELIGSVSEAELKTLRPELRKIAAGGLTAAYAGGAVVGFFYGTATVGAGAAFSALGASKVTMFSGLGILISSVVVPVGLQFMEATNPVAHFERGNVEKCLVRSQHLTNSTHAVVINLKNADDYRDTVKQIRDLVQDLNH